MRTIDLGGSWSFKAVDAYRTLPPNHRSVTGWMQASIPGTVHTDLLSNGRIPDPFYRLNETEVQWVDSQQWLYRREFEVDRDFLSQRTIDLLAEGLDTYALVRVNGKVVGETADMFVEHRLDVKSFLKQGKNVIEILFDSPTLRSKILEQRHGSLRVALEPHRVYVRKAQYSFGWDWGPRLTTSGIWKDIRLEGYSHPVLRNPFVRVVKASPREALLEISVEADTNGRQTFDLLTTLSRGEYRLSDIRKIGKSLAKFRLRVPRPELWWPNGYGGQPLYNAQFMLSRNGEEVHSLEIPFGIRTVRLLQQKDGEGTSFVIEVNGEKIFCKGADWIPCDTFIPRIGAATYETLLTMASRAHMNMIRVWGGGIYEQEVFYRLCDRLGLMVWQDFMFACGEYPEQRWFVRQVEDEATKAVKRLRNHPSVVLWCGNNECEWLFCTDNPGKSPDNMKGAGIFRDVLSDVTRRFDGTRPYWRSSPFGKGFPNDESNGNHHEWNVWSFWKDYGEYLHCNARFISEFGFQAPANRATFEKVTEPEDRTPQSIVVEHHNKQTEGTERLFRFQSAHHVVGGDFSEFIYKGQLVQAEALKTAVEHWRRRKFRTAGALFWQLNDCWPVSSWAVVDSSLRPKAAYYYAKRFFAPILLSFKRKEHEVELWLTNDHREKVKGTVVSRLLSFDGNERWVKEFRALVPGNSSRVVGKIPLSVYRSADVSADYILSELRLDGNPVAENRLFFAEPKHLRLPAASPAARLEEEKDGRTLLVVETDKFVKDCRIEFEGAEVGLCDNYFDIDAGASRKIRISSDRSADELRASLRLTWLQV